MNKKRQAAFGSSEPFNRTKKDLMKEARRATSSSQSIFFYAKELIGILCHVISCKLMVTVMLLGPPKEGSVLRCISSVVGRWQR